MGMTTAFALAAISLVARVDADNPTKWGVGKTVQYKDGRVSLGCEVVVKETRFDNAGKVTTVVIDCDHSPDGGDGYHAFNMTFDSRGYRGFELDVPR